MTQLPSFDEQAVAQFELEQYISQQAESASDSIKSSTQNFLAGDNSPNAPVPNRAASEQPIREPLKHLLIGSPKAVTNTIQYLHQLGYAQIGDWSPLLPTVNANEVMSILSKQILVQ